MRGRQHAETGTEIRHDDTRATRLGARGGGAKEIWQSPKRRRFYPCHRKESREAGKWRDAPDEPSLRDRHAATAKDGFRPRPVKSLGPPPRLFVFPSLPS